MRRPERETFADMARRLAEREAGAIQYRALTVAKKNVQPHIRADSNKLYNYMIKLLLLSEMQHYDQVLLIPDQRSIKVQSGNSLHDYLQTELWFECAVSTTLETQPSESSGTLNIQFADMLAGAVQSYYEDGQRTVFEALKGQLYSQRLFFR